MTAPNVNETPKRVAIIGGGCAGLAAALELTDPALDGQYAVTVYQMGWRLGGKGASGRGPHDRIEEHGTHAWMGCYENAFRMIRGVYDSLADERRDCPIVGWRDAFSPLPHIGLAHWSPEQGWDVWSTYFPPLPGLPGDPLGDSHELGTNPFSINGYLLRCVAALGALLEASYAPASRDEDAARRSEDDQQHWHGRVGLVERARRVLAGGLAGLRSPAQLRESLRLLAALFTGVSPPLRALTLGLLELVNERIGQVLGPANHTDQDALLGAAVAEIMATCIRGCIVDGALGSEQGFELVDEWDFRDWLLHHGASERSVNSTFIRGLYNLMFAYEDGDPRRPMLAAGVALRVCVRMFFTYRGALFWRMTAGMGEIVFTPIYQLLRKRGVRFEFFHRLEHLHTITGASPETSRVSALEFSVQARPQADRYEPLIDVRGLPCWPSEPLWGQLEAGETLRAQGREFEAAWDRRCVGSKLLEAGRDFDFVVMAVSLGEIPNVCGELITRHRAWREMVARVKTVATQAFQLWLTPTMEQLGWARGPIMMTGFHHPFDSWADHTPLIPHESWPADHQPGALAYFCNVLAESNPEGSAWTQPDYHRAMRAQAEDNAVDFLERQIGALWPGAVTAAGDFRWELLTAPEGVGPSPLASQYVRANCGPSDRYVLSVPGSTQYRISPLDRHCENLTIAGDWTECGINVGCIEAAVMSGMLAAHALTGWFPSCESIVGYHHP